MEGWKSVQGWQKRLPESLKSHKTGLKVKKKKKINIGAIIFYLVIKYGNESKDELLKIETALENDGILRDVDQPQPINVMSETGKKSERDEVVGNVADPNKINVELNENTFVKMFIKNLFEFYNLGIGGNQTKDLVARLESDFLPAV